MGGERTGASAGALEGPGAAAGAAGAGSTAACAAAAVASEAAATAGGVSRDAADAAAVAVPAAADAAATLGAAEPVPATESAAVAATGASGTASPPLLGPAAEAAAPVPLGWGAGNASNAAPMRLLAATSCFSRSSALRSHAHSYQGPGCKIVRARVEGYADSRGRVEAVGSRSNIWHNFKALLWA